MNKFKEILAKIWNWLKANPSFSLILVIVILIFLLFQQCGSKKKSDAINKQNIAYFTDSLRKERTKNGQLEYAHNVLIADKNELKKINDSLYHEVIKEKGIVKYLESIGVKIVHDTLYLHDTRHKKPDGSYDLNWKYTKNYDANNYQKLAGVSNFIIDTTVTPNKPVSRGTMITQNEIGLNIITGLKKNPDTKAYEIFARSDYPGFQITKLDGAVLDKNMFVETAKKKRFSLGPNISFGIGTQFKVEVYIGFGLQYAIFMF
jgi:hypothetical protein